MLLHLLLALVSAPTPVKLYAISDAPSVHAQLLDVSTKLESAEAILLTLDDQECRNVAQSVHGLRLEVAAVDNAVVSLAKDVKAGTLVADPALIRRYSAMIRYIGKRIQDEMVPVAKCGR